MCAGDNSEEGYFSFGGGLCTTREERATRKATYSN